LLVLALTVAPARAQDETIPTDGLELWVKADGPMTVTNGQIAQWTDLGPKGNNAIHDAFGQATPTVATANGQPTLRWSGVYSGFHFTQITTIRTVFAVLSKVSSSCLPTLPNYGTSAKFWLGGNALPTFFHPEHGCCIYNTNLSEVSPNLVNGKTYLNGKLIDGRTTQFPLDQLGLLSIVALGNVSADTIGRDRNFQDRSWQGDISELIIYSTPLDDATRVSIETMLTKKYAIGAASGSTDGGAVDASAGGAGGASGAGGRSGADAAADRAAGGTSAGGTGTGTAIGAGGSGGIPTGGSSAAGGSSGGATGIGTAGAVGPSGGNSASAGGAVATGGAVGAGGTSAPAGGVASLGGTLGSGGTVLASAGGASPTGGAISTSAATGGASAITAASGGHPDAGVSSGKSSGCSYATAERDHTHFASLLPLGVGLALLRRTRRQ
jgi:hypothetical protein